ncbi:MAG: cupin domain-containing protein, partial [Acidobacteria bacterium]|nr:cupin domain-containing protein [Acidobacteriota bacterium]
MDALSDVLKSVRLEGAFYLNAEFTAPWCIRGECNVPSVRQRLAGAEHVLFFHFLTEGACKLRLADSSEVLEAQAGDLILIPQESQHLLGSDLQLAPLDTDGLVVADATTDDFIHLRHGGGGAVTRFVCGYLACSRSVCRPLFEALPRVLCIPVGAGPTSALLRELLRLGVRESSTARPGTDSMLAK